MVAPKGLYRWEIITGFSVKVLLGWLYGYIYLRYYGGDDTWKMHGASLRETALLLSDPAAFFINEFTPAMALAAGNSWLQVAHLYLNDLQYALVVKSMAIVNLVTQGNYYLNTFVFNAFVFWGHYWLFLLMDETFPGKRKRYFFLIFLFLPVVFWLSGYRVDGLLFTFLSLFLLYLFTARRNRRSGWLVLIIAYCGVVICRPEFSVCLLIAAIAYSLTLRFNRKPLIVFAGVYAAAVLLFFSSSWVLPGGGIPGVIARTQHAFLQLQGTRFQLDALDEGILSYIRVLPQALANTLIRPFLWEAAGALQLMAAFEVLMFWLIVIACLLRMGKGPKLRLSEPVMLMMLSLAVSVYVFIGYIVPFPGAIIRYKAIPELLIICSMIALTNTKKQSN